MTLATKVDGWIRKFQFLMRQRAAEFVTRPSGLRVLFSRQDHWEPMIRAGLRGTQHLIAFGDLPGLDLGAFDVIVPLTIDAVLYLATHRADMLKNRLPIPAAESVSRCHDKCVLADELIRLGYGEFVPRILDDPAPPFILKPKIGENSENCHIVHDDGDRARLLPLMVNDQFFCQELVRGASEFASHILIQDGKIVAELTIEYVAPEEVFIKGNCRFITTRIRRCPFPELFARMLAGLEFEGLCCINFKIENGHPWLLEINPRFGYSLGPYFSSFLHRIAIESRALDAGSLPAIDPFHAERKASN